MTSSPPPRRGRPPRPEAATAALFVRIPAETAARLDRAALELRTPKRDLVTALVARYVDPDDPAAMASLRSVDPGRRVVVEPPAPALRVGRHEFRSAPEREVLTVAEAAELLQVEEAVVLDLASRGELPGRRLGSEWRFARRALLGWLASGETR